MELHDDDETMILYCVVVVCRRIEQSKLIYKLYAQHHIENQKRQMPIHSKMFHFWKQHKCKRRFVRGSDVSTRK